MRSPCDPMRLLMVLPALLCVFLFGFPVTAEEPLSESNGYDPKNESPLNVCRRNPTWRDWKGEGIVDYETCLRLSGWKPRDYFWRQDARPVERWLPEGLDEKIAECINESFRSVPSDKWWADCNEKDRTVACRVEDPLVMAHYAHIEEGDIVTVRNALTEQEAYGIQSLDKCMQKFLPHKEPFYKERLFGESVYGVPDKEHLSLYAGSGGNMCTFMQGMTQKYLPGVASSLVHAVQQTYDQSDWNEMVASPPNMMGLRSVELLAYNKTGRLGVHVDADSIYTISVALSEPEDFEGGYFHLYSEHQALFKIPKLSAVVFFSETNHGITPIDGGNRQVFVAEMWEDDDTPIGLPRPGFQTFETYQRRRQGEFRIKV